MKHPGQANEAFVAETKVLMEKLEALMAEFPNRQFILFTAERGTNPGEANNLSYISKMHPGLMQSILTEFLTTQLGHVAPGASIQQLKAQRDKLN